MCDRAKSSFVYFALNWMSGRSRRAWARVSALVRPPTGVSIRDSTAQHLIFLTVLDQNGNGVDGTVVRNLVGDKSEVTTGNKGPGKAEITMYYEPFKLTVASDPSGPVTSQVSNQMGLIFPHLPDLVGKLGDVNYEYGACPTLEIKCQWPLSAIHFSYEITFQKVK